MITYYYNPSGTVSEINKTWNQAHGYKNINMTVFNVENNLLSSLTLISASALTHLTCSNNQLTTLDVSSCPSILYLESVNNLLTLLNVKNCSVLNDLRVGSNQLTTLDITQNTLLTNLNCDSNQLTTLDLSQNNPSIVSCNNNLLNSINLSGNKSNLFYFTAQGNQLSSINLSNFVSIDSLYLGGNNLTNVIPPPTSASMTVLDIGENPWDNVLTPFDATKYPGLLFLYCSSISSSNIDLSNSKNLISLQSFSNHFSSLDFTACSHSLVSLNCSINGNLTSLNVSSCSVLQGVSCHEDNLTSLLISGSSLTGVICNSNLLPTIDVSKCPNLTTLSASNNRLTSGSINNIYINLDNFGLLSGSVSLEGSTNQSASGAGLTARSNLISKNWSIVDNI
jgi:hypothetical protein